MIFIMLGGPATGRIGWEVGGLTVDGNGHALGQDVAIGALESRDLAELVQLAVVVANALGRLGVDLLELDVVGLGDSVDGRGAGVALLRRFQLAIT